MSPETASELKGKVIEVDRRLVRMYGPRAWSPRYGPLDELIYTILSQNTTDTNSLRAFERLRERFTKWEELLRAPLEEVAAAISVGGLAEIKSVWIRDILLRLQKENGRLDLDFICDMEMRRAWEYLLSFKGVGPKTAAIVLLFSCGRPAFPVDTHVYRVSWRLGLTEKRGGPERTQTALQELIPPSLFYQMHVNMVIHGRRTCRAGTPACFRCLLTDICRYYRECILPGRDAN